MKKTASTAMGATLMATCVVLGATATLARGPKPAAALSAADLKWAESPAGDGVKIAPIRGDVAKGPHAMMVNFPAGTVHPLHAHSADIEIVTVSGTFRYGPEGGPEKSYGPGSYILIPGGARHTSGCTAEAACVLFHEATGKFDITMAQAAKGGRQR
jgi:quercetin dioxygenase-like cupin family protein